jgi:hypothetical protein
MKKRLEQMRKIDDNEEQQRIQHTQNESFKIEQEKFEKRIK